MNRNRVMKNLYYKERKFITQKKEKRSEDLETLEEVFDKSTLMIIYKLLNRRVLSRLNGVIKSGKESRVYWGQTPNQKDIAVKIFLTTSTEFKKGMFTYIDGDPRFSRIKRGTKSLIYLWAKKEFKNLQSSWNSGISVPKPLLVEGNVLLMEFIGTNGNPAPLLKEKALRDYQRFYNKVIMNITKLYSKTKLVHGDLSEYNIMVKDNLPILIDFSQAVNINHPSSDKFFIRDLENLNKYFLNLVQTISPNDLLEKVKTLIDRDKFSYSKR